MLSYHFLQEYTWFVISVYASLFAFLQFVIAGSGLLFLLGRDDRQRTLITDAFDRKWCFIFLALSLFALYAFTAIPGFQQADVGNGFVFWIFFTIPFALFAVAGESLHFIRSSSSLRTACQWVMVVCGWIIPYVMGFVNCAFYTGTGNIGLLNIVNGFFGLSYVQTGALLYLHKVIDDDELDRRIIRLLAVTSSVFIVFVVYVAYLILSMDGLEYDADGHFYPVHLKYLTNIIALPHSLGCSIFGLCLILIGIVTALLFRMKRSFWFFAVGSISLLSSFIQIAGFNDTPVFPCYSDPQRSLSLANSCAGETTLFILFLLSFILVPLLVFIIIRFWHRTGTRHDCH